MKVRELIDYLYKCNLNAEVRIAWIDEYSKQSNEIAEIVQVSSKLTDDDGFVYLLQE